MSEWGEEAFNPIRKPSQVVPQTLKILNAIHGNSLAISYPDSAGSSSTSLILNVWIVPQETY